MSAGFADVRLVAQRFDKADVGEAADRMDAVRCVRGKVGPGFDDAFPLRVGVWLDAPTYTGESQ